MESIIERLSSRRGERREGANMAAAEECILNPSLLDEIAAGLSSEDARLAGDCAEVLTMTAKTRPELVATHAEAAAAARTHKAGRVRWEAAHCLALVAQLRPDLLVPLVPAFMETIRRDESIIVRDYSIDILAGMASAGEEGAGAVVGPLVESLGLWGGRHAGHALAGLGNAARFLPRRKEEIRAVIMPFLSSDKGAIQKAARKALKACA